jgi:hypothetical protein
MSSSVIVARTRMCRTTVAIMRGESLCGAWWHRPQLVANLFSPSIRNDSSSRTLDAEVDAAAGAGTEARVGLECAIGAGIAAGVAADNGVGGAIEAELEIAAGCDAGLLACCAATTWAQREIPAAVVNAVDRSSRHVII